MLDAARRLGVVPLGNVVEEHERGVADVVQADIAERAVDAADVLLVGPPRESDRLESVDEGAGWWVAAWWAAAWWRCSTWSWSSSGPESSSRSWSWCSWSWWWVPGRWSR